jgi:hypothetical protein
MNEQAIKTTNKKTSGKINRRTLLKGAGAVLVATGAGGVWRAWDRGVFAGTDGPAFQPWTDWRTAAADPGEAIVRAGILAASAHNTQPWLFAIDADRVTIYADTSRHLGSFDPYLREMHISLGCAVENMVLAARAAGIAADVTMSGGHLIDGFDGARPVAVLRLTDAEAEPSPLYDVIPDRHTNRGPYDRARGVPDGTVAAMTALIGSGDVRLITFTDGAARDAYDAVMNDATTTVVADRQMVHDSHAWFRLTPDAIEQHRDGPTIDTFALPPAINVLAKMFPIGEQEGHEVWRETTRDVHLATAPMTGILAVRDRYRIADNLAAGRAWQRLHLWGTSQGLAMHPMNQPIEVVDRDRQRNRPSPVAERLTALTGEGWQATFSFRLGYGTVTAARSPRRDPADVMRRP